MDLTLCKSNTQPCIEWHTSQGYELSLWNPLRKGFADAKFYTLVMNSDYASQGAIAYGVRFCYSHAVEETRVDTSAPAYAPRTTAVRVFLKKLFDKLDLPRPGDDFRQRFAHNTQGTIIALAKLLVDPATTSALELMLGRDVRADVAASCATTAKVASAMGIVDTAEDLHKAALAGFETVGDRKRQIEALKALAEFYDHSNLPSKAGTIRTRIQLLGGPVR